MSEKKIVLVSHNVLGFRSLKKMLEKNFRVVGVFSRRPQKRPEISDYCGDFAELCNKENVPFHYCSNINEEEVFTALSSMKPDAILVMGWSQIIGPKLFSVPTIGIFGTHPSLLPKNRGSAAIPWQIILGEKESALTFFKIEESAPVDGGEIYAQEPFALDVKKETAASFYEKAVVAAEKIVEVHLDSVLEGKVQGQKQDETAATYLGKRKPEDGLMDWSQSSGYLERFVRALGDPYPGAFTYYSGQKIKIIQAKKREKENYTGTLGSILSLTDECAIVQCGSGLLEIEKITNETGEALPLKILKYGNKLGPELPELLSLYKKAMRCNDEKNSDSVPPS